jgi:hypothetical protein
MDRPRKVNDKELGVGAPNPTLRSSEKSLAEQKAGANAHSLANKALYSKTKFNQYKIRG